MDSALVSSKEAFCSVRLSAIATPPSEANKTARTSDFISLSRQPATGLDCTEMEQVLQMWLQSGGQFFLIDSKSLNFYAASGREIFLVGIPSQKSIQALIFQCHI